MAKSFTILGELEVKVRGVSQMKINWPDLSKKEAMNDKELLTCCKIMIQELHDRWVNPSWQWGSFTHDPHALLEEIALYMKEGGSNKVKFREFI